MPDLHRPARCPASRWLGRHRDRHRCHRPRCAATSNPRTSSTGALPVDQRRFFLSGAAALVYQVAWQRSLLNSLWERHRVDHHRRGGLPPGPRGLGSLLGGQLFPSTWESAVALVWCRVSSGSGAFAAFSPALFRWVGSVTLGASLFQTAVLSFSLLLVPTVLMGATLPLLTEYAGFRRSRPGSVIRWAGCISATRSAALVAPSLHRCFSPWRACRGRCRAPRGSISWPAPSRSASSRP